MKRFLWALSLVAMGMLAWSMLAGPVRASGGGNGAAPAAPVVLSQATRGVVFGTAAINTDGTVASCFGCNPSQTVHLGTGEYQVAFTTFGQGSIVANKGFSRWVQVDTLTTGSINNTACSTADRAGVPSAIYIQCYNGSGTFVDTSFFLFVAR